MRFAWLIGKASETLRICNTYCFCIETVAARTRLIVTFIRILHVSFFFLLSTEVNK